MIIDNTEDSHFFYLKEKKNYKKKIIKCEICERKKFYKFQNIGRVGRPLEYGSLNVVICEYCSHRFLNPRYVDDFYLNYYKKKYRKIAFGTFKPSKFYIDGQIKRGKKILEYFKDKISGNRMLDHGCASGGTMVGWKKKGWSVIGIDPHQPSVQYGKQKFKFNILQNFGEKLNLKSKSVDVVMALGSLEHAYDIKKTLKEIFRVLDNVGYLIIRWRSDKLTGSPLEYYNHNHYRFFDRKTLQSLLAKYQFKVVENTDQMLEGYKNYQYSLAVKNQNFKKINKNFLNKDTFLKSHESYLKKYYKICKEFNTKKTYKSKIAYIKKKKIFLLPILKKNALGRYIKETSIFKRIYESR